MVLSAACFCFVAASTAFCDCAAWVSISRLVPSKLARECRGTRLCLFEGAALWLGSRRHRLRGLGFLHHRGGLLLLLLQGLLQFRDGALRRLLLLRGGIDCLLRLRGLGLDLAAVASKLARESRGTRLCLFECAALGFGRRHRLRGLGFLHHRGGLLLLLLQSLSQFRDSALRRLLLFRGGIDCLLRLRGLALDLAALASKLARESRGPRLCLFECAALGFGGRRHRLCGLGFLHHRGGLLLLLLQSLSQFRDSALRRLLLFRGGIDCLLRLRGLALDLAALASKLACESRGPRLCLFECAALGFGAVAIACAALASCITVAVFCCSCSRACRSSAIVLSAACFCFVAASTAFCDCAAWLSISRLLPASSLARAAARACASSSARRWGSAAAAIACATLASCITVAVFCCSCSRACRSSAIVLSAACFCFVAASTAFCDCAAWLSISRLLPASSLARAAARACASSSARRWGSAAGAIACAALVSCVETARSFAEVPSRCSFFKDCRASGVEVSTACGIRAASCVATSLKSTRGSGYPIRKVATSTWK